MTIWFSMFELYVKYRVIVLFRHTVYVLPSHSFSLYRACYHNVRIREQYCFAQRHIILWNNKSDNNTIWGCAFVSIHILYKILTSYILATLRAYYTYHRCVHCTQILHSICRIKWRRWRAEVKKKKPEAHTHEIVFTARAESFHFMRMLTIPLHKCLVFDFEEKNKERWGWRCRITTDFFPVEKWTATREKKKWFFLRLVWLFMIPD